MNYPESRKILDQIKKSKNIIISCHKEPDADSLGSSLSLYYVLKRMGKNVLVVSLTTIRENIKFLKDANKVKIINYNSFDFSQVNLFFALDSASPYMVTGDKKTPLPKVPIVLIDHHKTNTKYGKLNLIDKATSTAEILYRLYQDWKVEIDKQIATALLAGIIGDTGLFKFDYGMKPDSKKEGILSVSQKLIDLGADKPKIVRQLMQTIDIDLMKFWGEVLTNLKIDKKHKFAYSAIPYDSYKKYNKPEGGASYTATNFASSIKDTEFGMILVEKEKKVVEISLRGRSSFDTSKIAVELGGGGHAPASGATISGIDFKKVLDQVLKVARKYSK